MRAVDFAVARVEARLAGTFKKTRISILFSGSGAFVNLAADTYDTLVVDEAHRLNEKSGLYRNLGDNQVRELIRSARCTVFFVDDDQRVTLLDIGHTEELRRHARELGAEETEWHCRRSSDAMGRTATWPGWTTCWKSARQ